MGQIGLSQTRRVVQLLEESDITPQRFEQLNRSGLLSDLLNCSNPSAIDRCVFRHMMSGIRVRVEKFPVWAETTIGGVAWDKLVKKVEDKADGLNVIQKTALDLIRYSAPETEKKRRKVKLSKVTFEDLGFTQNVTLAKAFARAQTFGLLPCSPEVALYLWLDGQSEDDAARVSMQPMPNPDSTREEFGVLYVTRRGHGFEDTGQWTTNDLGMTPTNRDAGWANSKSFVFETLD